MRQRPRAIPALALLGLGFVLAGCTGGVPIHMGTSATARFEPQSRELVSLTPAQECAVGYDLARQVYQTVSVNGTPIRVGAAAGGCTRHAAEYLRRAGFAVTENATGKGQFGISTYAMASAGESDGAAVGSFIAVARLPGFVVTRAYRPGEGGVYPMSPVSVRSAGGSR